MSRSLEPSAKRIEGAWARLDLAAVHRESEAVEEGLREGRFRVEAPSAKRILGTLRESAMFADLEKVAGAFHVAGDADPAGRRLYGQALIELGKHTEALAVLSGLAEGLPPSHPEWVEAQGLIGRCYKQMYLAARPNRTEPREADVQRALAAYRRPYELDRSRNWWHGINLVALLDKRHRVATGSPIGTSEEGREVAREVIRVLEPAGDADPWSVATRAEARLGLGQIPEFHAEMQAYLRHPEVSRFHLQSTLRQLREMWDLTDESEPGRSVLPPLVQEVLRRGGQAEVSPRIGLDAGEAAAGYQAILSRGDGFFEVGWLERGVALGAAICRVTEAGLTRGRATGFLIDGRDFPGKLRGDPYVVTNAHVVCGDDSPLVANGQALRLRDLTISFPTGKKRPVQVPGRSCSLDFTSEDLDVSLLRLPAQVRGRLRGPCRVDPRRVTKGEPVYLIGYPGGATTLSYSLTSNEVVSVLANRFRYRAPTEPGSSGSPVFDRGWNVIGVHHYGDPERRWNQGVPFQSIEPLIRAARRPRA